MNRHLHFAFVAATVFLLASCGYHVGGKADVIPKNIQTIAIPPFLTFTSRYKLVDSLPEAIATEFRTRSRFHVVNDPSEADAVLNGQIISAATHPVIADPKQGQITNVRIDIVLTVKLVENRTAKVLYSRSNWAVHQDYAAAISAHQLFDESGPALERLDRDVARDLVSAVLENF